MKKALFLLEHTHDEKVDEYTSTEIKTLGIYSTMDKVEQAIQFFKTLPGFKDYSSDDNFTVDEFEVDKNSRFWGEGFVTVEGIQERAEPETPEEIEYVKNCLKERIREKQEELKELQEDLNKYSL